MASLPCKELIFKDIKHTKREPTMLKLKTIKLENFKICFVPFKSFFALNSEIIFAKLWGTNEDVKVKIYNEDAQCEIIEILDNQQREISLLRKQLEQYKLQKQSLMQKLLTGEWKVK